MKFTFNWLKDYLQTNESISDIVNCLNNIGLEVEGVTQQATKLAGFTIAKIISTKPHPEANKLQICLVDDGNQELSIICGAPNARAGLKVVLAPVGVVIPANNIRIKETKIRNVLSSGMLCSFEELNMPKQNDGIIELPEDTLIGEELNNYLGLNDTIIEVNVTPNRGDLAGIYGIARDLAAAGMGKLIPIEQVNISQDFKSNIDINLEVDELDCSQFIAYELIEVINQKSPNWLKNRLEAIGEKSNSALVDITNYVNYSFNRPLHVYDRSKISGNIITIRRAKIDEQTIALNNKTYKLNNDDLVIADNSDILSIAGIMGSLKSSCQLETTQIILEAANFAASKIISTGRKYAIDSASRYRFERKIDPNFTEIATSLTVKMIQNICSAKVSLIHKFLLPIKEKKMNFSWSAIKKISGINIEFEQASKILIDLGFIINSKHMDQEIIIPSWRHDIDDEADIVEELLRIYGLNNIKSNPLPPLAVSRQRTNQAIVQRKIDDIRRLIASLGVDELITWSFMDKEKAKLFSSIKNAMIIKNPISIDLNIMRPTVIANLLEAVRKNEIRGVEELAFFEIGPVFDFDESKNQPIQYNKITTIRAGYNCERNLYYNRRLVDVFDAKGDIISCLNEWGVIGKIEFIVKQPASHYHPARAGVITINKQEVGNFGELHPKVIKSMNVKSRVIAWELDIEKLSLFNKPFKQKPYEASIYQAVKRDYCFIVDKKQDAQPLIDQIIKIDKQLIKSVQLFDIYEGLNIAENKKSLAFSVIIQANDRTLTEIEIDKISSKIIVKLQEQFFAILREQY